MSEAHWTDAVARLNPCSAALTWLRTQPDAETAWQSCERGDWMLWLAGKLAGPPESDGRKPLVLSACACARLALPHWTARYPNDNRVLTCIETAERWARGEATLAGLREAREAADAADAYVAYAVDATATAAAVDAYVAAVDAAYAAAYVAADAAYAADAAKMSTLKQCANLVRTFYPTAPELPHV